MKSIPLALILLCTFATVAAAQSAAGQDGKPVYYSSGTWQCTKVRFPNGATSGKMLTTGVNTVCASGTCSNAGGDADLWVYGSSASGAAPGVRAGGYSCRPYLTGNEEACTIPTATADWYYWMCVDGYSNYNQIQIRAEYNLGVNASNTAVNSYNTWWIDYWKNNLFLGVAYHRFGCVTNNMQIVSEREYDGFTDTDYCRLGRGLSDPATRGGDSTYMNSTQYTGWYLSDVTARLDICGSSTNTTYNTPNYQRRSNSCSYNVMTNCTSDCWIKKFSACERGSSISILSPCW